MAARESDFHERREERRSLALEGERFDRLRYATRLLDILRPKGMTVAVYEGNFGLRIEQGRDWGGRDGSSWAMVAIPPDATREHIAVALAELAGVARVPYVMGVLIAAGADL